MPYPAQIDRDTAIDTARAMIEADGAESLSLAKLATALGIKAPSLYHHFKSKADLLQDVNLKTSEELVASIQDSLLQESSRQPQTQLQAIASAYRRYALEHPVTTLLAFGNLAPDNRPDPAQLEALALPLQAAIAGLVGEADALDALRGLWALVHGFVMLEINGQFQRGGDPAAALSYAVDAYAAGCIQLKSQGRQT